MNKKTHFGYKEVDVEQKVGLVKDVFDSVAENYDLMNDLMSFGIHRIWKNTAVELASLQHGQKVLDLASGTGDLASRMLETLGDSGSLIMSDINFKMLDNGRNRMTDEGKVNNVGYILANAENLPFKENYFDCVTMAFGLRNVTNKKKVMEEVFRVLKPSGKFLILEFSKPQTDILNKVYDFYSFNFLPKIGNIVANDGDSYQYLAESIRKHPNQQILQQMMESVGFADVKYKNLTQGVVAIHTGIKLL